MTQENSALVEHKENMPMEARKTNDSTFDRIYKYFHNNKTRVELYPDELVIMERWEKAWLLLCRRRTQKQVADLLMKLYGIKRSVAFDDVRNAMMLFTNPNEDLKEAKRAIMETALLQGADKAWKSNDLDNHLKYMKAYAEINGLKEESDMKMADLMKTIRATQIIIVASKEELEAQANEMQEALTRDADFKIVE